MTTSNQLVWVLAALSFLTTMAVVAHIMAKWKHATPIRMDDYMAIAARVCLLVSYFLAIVSTVYGYGQHLADLGASPTTGIRALAVSEFFALVALACGKTSIGIRLRQPPDSRQVLPTWVPVRRLRTIVRGLIMTVDAVILVFAIFFWVVIWEEGLVQICKENRGVWSFAMFGAAWAAATDFAFAIFLWPFVQHMNGRGGAMVGLGLAIGFGIVSAVVGVVKISQMDCGKFQDDITHDSVSLVIWTFAESAVVAISASVPVLPLLFRNPPQTGPRREQTPWRGSAGLAPSHTFPPAAHLRRTRTWSIGGESVDNLIPLQSLRPRTGGLARVDTDESNESAISQSQTGEPSARPPFQQQFDSGGACEQQNAWEGANKE